MLGKSLQRRQFHLISSLSQTRNFVQMSEWMMVMLQLEHFPEKTNSMELFLNSRPWTREGWVEEDDSGRQSLENPTLSQASTALE